MRTVTDNLATPKADKKEKPKHSRVDEVHGNEETKFKNMEEFFGEDALLLMQVSVVVNKCTDP